MVMRTEPIGVELTVLCDAQIAAGPWTHTLYPPTPGDGSQIVNLPASWGKDPHLDVQLLLRNARVDMAPWELWLATLRVNNSYSRPRPIFLATEPGSANPCDVAVFWPAFMLGDGSVWSLAWGLSA